MPICILLYSFHLFQCVLSIVLIKIYLSIYIEMTETQTEIFGFDKKNCIYNIMQFVTLSDCSFITREWVAP